MASKRMPAKGNELIRVENFYTGRRRNMRLNRGLEKTVACTRRRRKEE